MAITKNIIEIINIKNSCKNVIQELYNYDSRPNDIVRSSYPNSKIDDAIRLDILEYDEFDDELCLSYDTKEYYKTRMGQNDETYIGLIGERVENLHIQLKNYNIRVKNIESTQKELQNIYKLLNQIPSILKHNLQVITSNSIFAFKSEPNFDIKIVNLNICQNEILELIDASNLVDKFLKEQQTFLKSMKNKKINSVVLKLKYNSARLEGSFKKLYDDIKNYINQSIKDGEFIKKLQHLKELKVKNKLFSDTNIEELSELKPVIVTNIKEKRIHPDDRIHDYIDTIKKIIASREIELTNKKVDSPIIYDVDEKVEIQKSLYNYPKLNQNFLAQDEDLITFLIKNNIENKRLLGVFIRMLKNFSSRYKIENKEFITIDDRQYIKIFSNKVK